jgi:HNH endonuclease
MCVYCREPDTFSRNVNFGVDHYRPVSIARFNSLKCDYNNLYYCCTSCNSRKRAYWPADEINGPYVVNPCDFTMTQHIRFDASTSLMLPRGESGRHTCSLLQLNDPATVQFRNLHVRQATLTTREIARLALHLAELPKLLATGRIGRAEFNVAIAETNADLDECRDLLAMQTGTTPLAPLPKSKLGVTL